MKATIIAATREVLDSSRFVNDDKTLKDQSITFGGKQAGICYMGESYFDSNVTDTLKAVRRFYTTTANDHHSIIDHCQVTILFEGLSKMIAMVLNSLQYYCTSEKSGRYTIMSGSSQIEQDLYTKWMEILTDRIKEVSPDIDFKMAVKIAQENARYFLSVFTKSTTMSYTTSYRQWNYIMDWCLEYINSHQTLANDDSLYYESTLYNEILELYSTLKKFEDLYIPELRDPNQRHFSFLANQTCDLMAYSDEEQFGEMYKIKYFGSFVQLAQAERHRTLKHVMRFNGVASKFYVPRMVMDTPLEKEWLGDMVKVADRIPQGTLAEIVECGYIGDFFLKCKERLCGRAQLEIMEQTCNTLKQFLINGTYSENVKNELIKFVSHDGDNGFNISTKCMLRHGCKEFCMHGPQNALTRLF